jgi:hypothetical protein
VLSRLQIALLDAAPQGDLLLRGEQRDLVDLLEIGFQAAFGRNGGLRGIEDWRVDRA